MLQYNALKNKLYKFPDTKFIIWTPAVFVKNRITEDEAKRTQQFYRWLIDEWNEKGDNIYLWDFYQFETEGGLYLLDKYAEGPSNSHPSKEFSAKVSPHFSKFIIDVLNGLSSLKKINPCQLLLRFLIVFINLRFLRSVMKKELSI